MNTKIKASLALLAITISFIISNKSYAASTNTVYSIATGAPLVTSDSIKVNTITRGFSANNPVYKTTVQTVSKTLLTKTFKAALAVTPYGLAALTAFEVYNLVFDEDGQLVNNSVTSFNPDSRGYCTGWGGNFTGTYSACFAKAQTYGNAHATQLSETEIRLYHDSGFITFIFNGEGDLTTADPQPATDDELFDALSQYINDNPQMDHSGLFLNPNGSVNQDYFPDPDFQLNTIEDSALLELYENGLLQSNDPSAANYVNPTEYARIQELYNQQNPTIEQQAEDLTAKIEQPLTQAQHQEDLVSAESRQDERLILSADALKDIDINSTEHDDTVQDVFDQTLELMNNTNSIPESELTGYLQFTSSATCETVALPFYGEFPTVSQCLKLGVLKSYLAWFLSILLSWNIINTLLKESN